jgi:hypothetical protein
LDVGYGSLIQADYFVDYSGSANESNTEELDVLESSTSTPNFDPAIPPTDTLFVSLRIKTANGSAMTDISGDGVARSYSHFAAEDRLRLESLRGGSLPLVTGRSYDASGFAPIAVVAVPEPVGFFGGLFCLFALVFSRTRTRVRKPLSCLSH